MINTSVSLCVDSGASTACLLAAELNSNMARIRAQLLPPTTASVSPSAGSAVDGSVSVPPGAEAWVEALAEQKAFARNSALLPPFAASQRAVALQWLSSLDAPLPRVKWLVTHQSFTILA
jgi:hypothetical protein